MPTLRSSSMHVSAILADLDATRNLASERVGIGTSHDQYGTSHDQHLLDIMSVKSKLSDLINDVNSMQSHLMALEKQPKVEDWVCLAVESSVHAAKCQVKAEILAELRSLFHPEPTLQEEAHDAKASIDEVEVDRLLQEVRRHCANALMKSKASIDEVEVDQVARPCEMPHGKYVYLTIRSPVDGSSAACSFLVLATKAAAVVGVCPKGFAPWAVLSSELLPLSEGDLGENPVQVDFVSLQAVDILDKVSSPPKGIPTSLFNSAGSWPDANVALRLCPTDLDEGEHMDAAVATFPPSAGTPAPLDASVVPPARNKTVGMFIDHVDGPLFQVDSELVQVRESLQSLWNEVQTLRQSHDSLLDEVRRTVDSEAPTELGHALQASESKNLRTEMVNSDQAMKNSFESSDCIGHAQADSVGVEVVGKDAAQEEGNDAAQEPHHSYRVQTSSHLLSALFSSAGGVISSSTVEIVLKQKNVHEVRATIWEAFIVMGRHVAHIHMRLQLLFALLCNIAMQSLFCVIIFDGFTRKENDPISSARVWRETAAHDAANMDMIRYTSLASRVCNKDISLHVGYEQKEFLLDIEQYAGDEGAFINTGMVLCMMVIVLYFLYMLPEVKGCVSFAKAIVALPRTRTTSIELDHSSEQFRIQGISTIRFASLLLITLIRSIIACSLLVAGSIWLARTANVENMILNAAALTIILEVDELIFNAMAPLPIMIMLHQLAPLERYSKDGTGTKDDVLWKMSSYQGCAAIGAVAVFVPPFMFIIVWPEYKNMITARNLMCDGNQDFVLGSNFQSQVIVATKTNPFSRDGTKTYMQRAVRELIDSNQPNTARLSAFLPVGAVFDAIRGQTMMEQVGEFKSCIDDPLLPAYLPQLRFYTQMASAMTCKDMRSRCAGFSQRLLRMLCPVSCGCAAPRSGLLLDGSSEGCPRSLCRQSSTYKQVLNSYDCRDLNTTELRALPGYAAFVNQWVAWGKMWYGAAGDPAGYDVVGQVLMGYGCQALLQTVAGMSMMSFCDETLSQSSMTAFCPVTCGCKSNPSVPSQCPAQCR